MMTTSTATQMSSPTPTTKAAVGASGCRRGPSQQTPPSASGNRAIWRVIEAKWPYGPRVRRSMLFVAQPAPPLESTTRCPMHAIPTRLAAIATFLAAAAALAGLALTGLYVDAPNWAQQARGTDLATLFLAVPVLAVGLWASTRGSSAGRLAVVAGLLYLVYNYAIFAFAVAMNPLTAVHIAIFARSLWTPV